MAKGHIPLKGQAASYDPDTGRQASAYGNGEPYTAEGERCVPWAPRASGTPGKGSPTWSAIDKAR